MARVRSSPLARADASHAQESMVTAAGLDLEAKLTRDSMLAEPRFSGPLVGCQVKGVSIWPQR